MDTTTETPAEITADLIGAIEAAWSAIRERHADVPAVVFSLGAGSGDRDSLKLGHFAASRWQVEGEANARAEIFVGGEGLQRGEEGILTTLLHEAAHALAHLRGIQETSNEGRYHNKRFAALAKEVGLTVSQDGKIGWSVSRLGAGTVEAYTEALQRLTAALLAWRHAEPARGKSTKRDRNPKAALCECETPRRIRVMPNALDDGPILCGVCGEEFTFREE